jgi:hypothetical protein
MATGLAGRLTSGDQPHGGINFRADEVSRFFAQHATDVVLGKGFGGRFLSVSGNGGTVITGWTHAFPLWIILKVGLAGLVVACVAARLAARRVIRRYRSDPPRRDMLALGSAIVAGILVMSLTLGVAALADGAMLLGFGGAFLSGPRPRRTRWALA